MPDARILSTLGLMRRAGVLERGADAVTSAAELGRARMIVIAADAGRAGQDAAQDAAERRGLPICPLPFTKADIGGALGCGTCAVAAICDTGFALSLAQTLALDPPVIEALRARLAREKRRKQKKLHSGRRVGDGKSTAKGTDAYDR